MLLKRIKRGYIDTSNLVTERDFIVLKAKLDKLDIINYVPIGLNNFKTQVNDLDVNKLK